MTVCEPIAVIYCTPPQTVRGCPSWPAPEPPSQDDIDALADRIARIVTEQGFHPSRQNVCRLAAAIAASEASREGAEAFLRQAASQSRTDILYWIAVARDSGDLDEAFWRAFLAGHLGRMSAECDSDAESAARLLCGFGDHPKLTWSWVSQSLLPVSQWLKDHQDQLNTLVFGNHRQYANISGGKEASNLYRVLESFVAWVDRYGQGSPAAAFDVAAKDPETRFAQLFSRLAEGPHHVYWMGRTGAFDLIDLLNDLGLLSARPTSPYLVGATGPLRGAKRIWGEHLSPRRLDELAAELARRLGVRMQALEDGLCNSQKGRLR